eukprot:scaffold198435_cov24-Prasinocladus_malaysianus.AAC.1
MCCENTVSFIRAKHTSTADQLPFNPALIGDRKPEMLSTLLTNEAQQKAFQTGSTSPGHRRGNGAVCT